MRKRVFMLILTVMCMNMLAGCGKEPADRQADENVAAEERGTDADVLKRMTREEVMETYYKPMEELLKAYYESTDPDEIERIAQEYNVLAVEGRLAYIEATGEAPNSEYIPRREYLMRSSYYRAVKDRLPDYDEMYVSYTFDEDDGNIHPSNMMVCSDDGQVSVNPEASDAIVYLLSLQIKSQG